MWHGQRDHFLIVTRSKLGGVLTRPLLLLNKGGAALDRVLGASQFDSWVMRFGH